MDTSETYIKMCEKAEEIQEQRPLFSDEHEYFAHKPVTQEDGDIINIIGWRYIAWLPRQDQLQILSGLNWYLFDKTCVTWATTNPDYQRESKEIVGLRVVYKEKYNKVWNGMDWVAEKVLEKQR